MYKKVKALVLFSGGLDSVLAVKMLQEQNIEVECVCLCSNFYGCEQAKVSAENIEVKLEIIDISQDMLDLVKNPLSGYGKNMNPCIDCHAMMMRVAEEYARENNFDFIATGEVVGQRPFSQNKDALMRVEKKFGGRVLRPLSARLLEETEIEKSGLVDRSKLGQLKGRTRDGQMELVKRYGLKEFPSPAGGCLLTDPEYAKRLADMMKRWGDVSVDDVKLLRSGRVFWFNVEGKDVLVVIGRQKRDNELLKGLGKKDDIMVELKEQAGPLCLVRGFEFEFDKEKEVEISMDKAEIRNDSYLSSEFVDEVMKMVGYYLVRARGRKVLVCSSVIK